MITNQLYPEDIEELRRAVENKRKALKSMESFITQCPKMLELKRKVKILEKKDCNVLITGETGTGKELIARGLHNGRRGRFIGINCSAMPGELIESELFGHEKGAFTGATKETNGLIAEAKDGTLFLDEIGDMPKMLQSKLLRVLETLSYRKVGGTEFLPVECRIVAATWQTTEELLRPDLYYRLATVRLHTTPLRDRIGDIALIIEDFIEKNNLSNEKTGMLEQFMNKQLLDNVLPGNVRQLLAYLEEWKVFNL